MDGGYLNNMKRFTERDIWIFEGMSGQIGDWWEIIDMYGREYNGVNFEVIWIII